MGWEYSIGVRMIKTVRAAVEEIDEQDWQRIDYPQGGEAQIAETTYGERRLIVRRTRLLGAQAELWPDWRHFCFITNRTETLAVVEAEHREHAVVEQVIADLKDQALAHFPSGEFHANGAWTVLAALAHNMLRWTQLLGLPNTTIRTARTLRRRLLSVPGRLTRHARGWTLHLPARWPWHGDYITALARIRALPQPRPNRPPDAFPDNERDLAYRARAPLPQTRPANPQRRINYPAERPSCLAITPSPPPPKPPHPLHATQPPHRWIRAKDGAFYVVL